MFNRNKPYYLSNPLLKAANVNYSYSQHEINEFVKCSKDIIYFVEKYVKIISLDKGLHTVVLRDYQKEFLLSCVHNRKVITMQARQNGKGMVMACFLIWTSIFRSNEISAILANKAPTARETLKKFKVGYENLPWFLQQGVKKWNETEVVLGNGSRIIAAATSSAAIRGFTITNLLLDEYAIVEPNIAEEFFTSVAPTISSGKNTKIIIASTPLGLNHFWKLWKGAENKEKPNGFVQVYAPWFRNPDRDDAWAENERRSIGDVKFDQEYQCVTGNTTVTVKNKLTGEIKEILVEELYNLI